MQSFTQTEIKWMIGALQEKARAYHEAARMADGADNSNKSGVRYYEIKDKRYTQAELDAMSNEKYNSEVFTFSVVYRHMELGKPLTGAFTIVGLTKKMDALRKARHLL